MNSLPRHEQSKLIKAVEMAVDYTRDGMAPNDAIEKVARDGNYTPNYIDRIVQSYNKAKSVFEMNKAASEDRAKSFPIASSQEVIQRIYSPKEKEASSNFKLPGDLSKVDFSKPLEKTASLEKTAYDEELSNFKKQHPSSVLRILENNARFMQKHASIAASEIGIHREDMLRAIDDVAYTMSSMSDKQLHKVARLCVNGYPAVGDKFMTIISKKINRDIPNLQKTAHGAVFPHEEPYISMQKAYSCAQKMADAELFYADVQKEAAGSSNMLSSFFANAAAERVGKPLAGVAGGVDKADKDINEQLDSNFFNEVKAIDAKRNLYDIILSDDFKDYQHNEVLNAWNALAKSHPRLMMQNPAAARTLLKQQLNSSGERDLFEIGQATKIESDMAKAEGKK